MIKIKQLNKIYQTTSKESIVAVDGIDMSVKSGELVILKGSSGSGKSTILSLIAGLCKPTTGEIIVDSKHISKLSDNFSSDFRRDNIGFIFQKYNLIPNLSVKENIILPLAPLNLAQDDVEEKLNYVMKMFKIEHKEKLIVKNLSGGEQQRVAIARAYINKPKIILADEPTANLDKKLSLHFIDILRELKKLGNTIVVATHDPIFFGLDFVDREIELQNGKIIR